MDEYAGLIRNVIFGSAFAGHQTAVLYSPPTPPGGADVITVGIFRDEAVAVDLGGSIVQSQMVQVDLRRDSIVGGPRQGASVTVRGELFEVFNVQGPDDVGICRLDLKRL